MEELTWKQLKQVWNLQLENGDGEKRDKERGDLNKVLWQKPRVRSEARILLPAVDLSVADWSRIAIIHYKIFNVGVPGG